MKFDFSRPMDKEKADEIAAPAQNEYDIQAEEFLSKHNIRMRVKYLWHKPHFMDDKESRDIFRISLYTQYHRMCVFFGQSFAHSDGQGSVRPTAYDVLACLTKYDPGTKKEFLEEFGLNPDSIKDGQTYYRVRREWDKVDTFFSENELTELREIN